MGNARRRAGVSAPHQLSRLVVLVSFLLVIPTGGRLRPCGLETRHATPGRPLVQPPTVGALFLPAVLRFAAHRTIPDIVNGSSIYARCIVRVERDDHDDKSLDAVDNYWYDGLGRVIVHEHDADADGVGDVIEYLGRDSVGRLRIRKADMNNDGVVDEYVLYEYGDGAFVRLTSFDGATGAKRGVHEWILNFRGDATVERVDVDADGTWDDAIAHRFEYDADGRVVTEETDWDTDGIPEILTIFTWSDGLLEGEAYDDGVDGTIEATLTYAYYPDGQLAQAEDSDARSVTRYYYDERGWWCRKEVYFGDRLAEYAVRTYDHDGRLVELLARDHVGGLTRWTRHNSCPRSIEPYATATAVRPKPSVPEVPH